MDKAHVCVSWDSHKNHVFKGFSHLQQNAEFVDMTLAAESHLVKVHQNIVALASPYLKAMLQSASCQHPVIFLNNVSHKILGYILEYIYTGEVQIPSNETDKFIEACKSLCITGVENINLNKKTPQKQADSSIERITKAPDNEFAAHITINSHENNYNLELLTNENSDIHGNKIEIPVQAPPTSICPTPDPGKMDYEAEIDNNIDVNGIKHFVILKQNGSSNEDIINPVIINANNKIKILGDEIITPTSLQTETNNLYRQFDTTTRNPIEITCDAKNVQFNSTEDYIIPSSHPYEITLNKDLLGNSNQDVNPFGIVTNTNDSAETGLNTVNIKLDTNLQTMNTTDDIPNLLVNKQVCKRGVNKNIKKIRSHIRLNQNQDKTVLLKMNKSDIFKMDGKTHFTVSTRGSIQMILNRFIYHSHHYSDSGRKRRWRCIDYRKMHCPAYIDTDNDVVIATEENHCHHTHDNQIRKKIKENVIFTTMTSAVDTINTFKKENS